jgi:hypothetical protein
MFCSDKDYANLEAVANAHPGAFEIIRVQGGWQVFETAMDAGDWEEN